MNSSDSGFAFHTMDSSNLDTIEEASGDDRTRGSDATEEKVRTPTGKTSDLALVREMEELFGKLKTGTATREEKDRLIARKEEFSEMKKELETRELRTLQADAMKAEEEYEIERRKKAIRSVIRSVASSECVDLLFIADGTSSMGPYIESVKKNIKQIVAKIKRTNGNLTLRLAFVCYRDLCDGQRRFEVLDFISSVHDFEDFVAGLRATGGGDIPEDMAGGIQKANSLSWKHPTRVAFLIADAPCHGTHFHSFHDDHPSGSPGVNIISELKALEGNVNPNNGSMSIYFAKITSATDKMLDRFEEMGVKLEVVDLKDSDTLTASVTKNVRTSIFKTITSTGGATRSLPLAHESIVVHKNHRRFLTEPRLKVYRITARKLSSDEWRKHDATEVKVFRNKPVKRMAELQAPLGVGKVAASRTGSVEETSMFMRRAAHPFAEGQIRIAYHGQLALQKKSLDKDKQATIFKCFKRIGTHMNARDQYLKQMEISNIVHFLAGEYNKSNDRPKNCAKIHCLPCCVVEEVSDENEKAGNRRFCAESPLPIPIGAEFVKYSNNTGYWNDDELDETLLRFTDYTYRVTEGYLMVTDLQGIKAKGGEYYLTDPVILCKEYLRFGNTNLGPEFMEKCISSTRELLKEHGWAAVVS